MLSNELLLSATAIGPNSCCRKLAFLSSFSSIFFLSTSDPRLCRRLTVSNTVSLFSVGGAAGKFRDRRELGFKNDGA